MLYNDGTNGKSSFIVTQTVKNRPNELVYLAEEISKRDAAVVEFFRMGRAQQCREGVNQRKNVCFPSRTQKQYRRLKAPWIGKHVLFSLYPADIKILKVRNSLIRNTKSRLWPFAEISGRFKAALSRCTQQTKEFCESSGRRLYSSLACPQRREEC